jgi:hypothetical protein
LRSQDSRTQYSHWHCRESTRVCGCLAFITDPRQSFIVRRRIPLVKACRNRNRNRNHSDVVYHSARQGCRADHSLYGTMLCGPEVGGIVCEVRVQFSAETFCTRNSCVFAIPADKSGGTYTLDFHRQPLAEPNPLTVTAPRAVGARWTGLDA